MLDVKVDRG